MRIPFLLIPLKKKRLYSFLEGTAHKLRFAFPGLEYDLKEVDFEISQVEYISLILLNSLLVFLIFTGVIFLSSYYGGRGIRVSLEISLLSGIGLGLLILLVHSRYPRIIARKKADLIDKNLIYALKDLLIQINSGIPLYNALANISRGEYGKVSEEFGKVVREVSTGRSMDTAIEEMALTSQSEYLRKVSWQVINTLKAGASLRGTLASVIVELTHDQKNKIESYANELNVWTLVYMLFAVAIPTIGATLLVILSNFAGFGVSKEFFIIFVFFSLIIQIILIGLVKSRRPVVSI